MKSSSFNAVWLQYVLIAGLIVIVSGIVGIFVLSQQILKSKAVSTDHYGIDAELAQEQIVRLQYIERILAENKAEVDKASLIVANITQYEYQDQVINDITSYAAQNGLDILGFDFGAKPGVTTNATPPLPGSTTQQRTTVTVRLDNNISYTSFLKFLQSIESNVTKMQLTGISLQPSSIDPNLILGPVIELEVYLK